jgi:hypothetical protein
MEGIEALKSGSCEVRDGTSRAHEASLCEAHLWTLSRRVRGSAEHYRLLKPRVNGCELLHERVSAHCICLVVHTAWMKRWDTFGYQHHSAAGV